MAASAAQPPVQEDAMARIAKKAVAESAASEASDLIDISVGSISIRAKRPTAIRRTPSVRMMLNALLKNVNQPLAIVLAGHKGPERPLPAWAVQIRDHDLVWMGVAQKGVESFVAHAVAGNVPFAMETVFSHWLVLPDGRVKSKNMRLNASTPHAITQWLNVVAPLS